MSCYLKSWKICILTVLFAGLNEANGQIENIHERPVPATQKHVNVRDTVAGFKGGKELLFSFIEKNFQMHDSVPAGEYIAVAAFIVDSTGHVGDVEITGPEKRGHNLPSAISSQLTRTFSMMPEWNPGYKNGVAVNSAVYLPLKFSIRDNKIQILTAGTEEKKPPRKIITGEKVLLVSAALFLILALVFFGGK